MKLLKIISILMFVLAVTGNIKSQQQEFLFNTDFSLNCQRVLEDNNGDYILIGHLYDTTKHYSAYIIKLTENFDTSIRIIENDTADIVFTDFIVTPDNKYLLIGSSGPDTGIYWFATENILVMKFDESLNLIFEKQYPININGYLQSPDLKILQDDEGKIYVAGKGLNLSKTSSYDVLLQLFENGDVANSNIFTEMGSIYAIMKNNGNIDGFYAMGMGFSGFAHVEILEVDTNLNYSFTEIDDGNYDLNFGPYYTAKWLNDSIYIFAGTDCPINSDYKDLCVIKLNNEHEIIEDPIWVGRPDTSDFGPRYSMDWTDPDYIYLCAYQSGYHVPFEINSLVAIIDSDLNFKGMKYYGKDLNFFIYTVCATDDGGAILAVGQHDYNDPFYDVDLIIWEIKAEDILTSASETTNPYDYDYGVFPNPGSEILYIQTARKGVNMQMFNDRGILVFENKFKDTFINEINTASLPEGVY
ncbi:MAG: T9SS type A sorting domain-containing protein, partial [Bacteroidales bacterium]|nr:T9SS type A sorting domain-containing protein [Bacteroidales bacterium]